MQKAATIVLGLLLTASAAAAAPTSFKNPGEFHGEWLGSQQVSWALLVFKNGTAAEFTAHSNHDATISEETRIYPLHLQREGHGFTPYKRYENTTQALPAPFNVRPDFPLDRAGSVFVVAERIELNLRDARGILSHKEGADSLQGFTRFGDLAEDLYRVPGQGLGPSVVVVASPTAWNQGAPFNLAAHGASYLEWYNADVACANASPCPRGGGPAVTSIPLTPGNEISSERHTYEVVTGKQINFHGHGTLDYVLFGASILTVGVDGAVRLPLASAEPSCSTCVGPDNQTFSGTGNITLKDLQVGPGGLQAEMGGDFKSAHFDELSVDPTTLFATRGALIGGVAVGGGWALLKLLKLTWPALFTRQKEDAVLRNDRRRRLYDCIQKQPGIHFREALRNADIPAGSGRHHVTKLVQASLVVERRHHNTVCLFPNDERFTDSWQETVALRDPAYRQLYDWIKANPEKRQGEIVAAFAASSGWRRGVTRKRVERLAAEGMLHARQNGRLKIYSVAKPVLILATRQQAVVGPVLA